MSLSKAVVTVLVILLCGCGSTQEPAEVAVQPDIVKAAPDLAKLLLENDQVAVTRFTLPPQAELPMHEGRDRVVYSLSDYKLQFKTQQEEPKNQDFHQGEAHWHPAGAHSVRNIGPTKAEYLIVTRKGPNPTPGVTSNLGELAPDQARVVFENQDAKILEVTLPPGGKQPVHKAAARVVYSLTPAKLKFSAGSQASETEHAAGDVHYHEGGEHQVANLSKEPVKYVVFELM